MILAMTHIVEEKGEHMFPEDKMKEPNVIDLGVAFVLVRAVVGAVKTELPETLHNKAIPVLQIIVVEGQPLLIPYETEEERDEDFDKVISICKEVRY